MKDETFKKIFGSIILWRAEMKNSSVPGKPNADLLRKAIGEIDKAGVPEGLVSYLVLISEYLFRLKLVDDDDIEKLLIDIESRLSFLMDHRAIYHVMKALEPGIRESMKEERRRPIVFETNLPKAIIELNVKQRSSGMYQAPPPSPKRITLGPLAPKKSGPLPWIAPWVAGSAINELLSQKSLSDFSLALKLVEALHGKTVIEEGDFRKRDKSLRGDEFTKFVNNYKFEYENHLKNESLMRGMRTEMLTWDKIIFAQWEPERPVFGHSPATFWNSPEMVYEILNKYNTKGKSSSKKDLKKKRGKK